MGNSRPHTSQLCVSDIYRIDERAGTHDRRRHPVAGLCRNPEATGNRRTDISIHRHCAWAVDWVKPLVRLVVLPCFYRDAGGSTGSTHSTAGHDVRHWPDFQSICRVHHGDAGNCAAHSRCRAQYANIAD